MRRVTRRPALRPVRWRPPGLDEWQIGLRAAAQLRRSFPDYWTGHVAGRRATADALLGVGAALVTLTSQIVSLTDHGLDTFAELGCVNLARVIDDPPVVLRCGEDPWVLLENFLLRPPLMVYGLDLNAEEQEDFEPLAVALTTLTGQEFFSRDLLADVLDAGDEGAERWDLLEAIVCETPRIAVHEDDFDRLCAALKGTTCHGADLGEVLAYSHQRTDNLFANVGYWEAHDMQAYSAWDLSWDDEPLEELGRKQEEARRLMGAFTRLQDRVTAKPSLFVDIAEAIAAEAQRLGLTVTWPGEDEEEATNDDANPNEDQGDPAAPDAQAEAAALAAA